MEKLPPKSKKKKDITEEDLLNMNKNEIICKIMQLEAQNAKLESKLNVLQSGHPKGKKKQKAFDFTSCHYRRVMLRILYFGWDFQGLEAQEDSNQTIEYHLFQALTKSCLIENREKSQYQSCAPTDKTASSFGQVISITLRSTHPPEKQHHPESISSELKYCKVLNSLLPKEIRVVAWMPVPDDKPEYSARLDCMRRQYKYYFPRSSLDVSAMKDACARIVGSHDYRHLCNMDDANGVVDFRQEIFKADILPVGEESEDPSTMYYLLIEGKQFLKQQITCIMGILILIGQGKEMPEVMTELLDVVKYPRKPQYRLALNMPLNLFKCSYKLEEEQSWIYDKHDLSYVITYLQKEWTIQTAKSTMIKEYIQSLKMENPKPESETIEKTPVVTYADCLLQGTIPEMYTPLLKRALSQEEIIEFNKKKRTEITEDTNKEQ